MGSNMRVGRIWKELGEGKEYDQNIFYEKIKENKSTVGDQLPDFAMK